jgi:hypothetical protein
MQAVGIVNYEQDFVGQNTQLYNWPSCLGCAEQWLSGMAQAASELKVPIQ